MKKYGVLTSLFTAVTFSLITTTTAAYPISNTAYFTCPEVSLLSNFGDHIAGFGLEVMLSQNNPIYFQSNAYPTGVPDTFSNYYNSGTDYDSISATVFCNYTSNNPVEHPFGLSYYVTNGKGGLVQYQNGNSINITFPVGVHF